MNKFAKNISLLTKKSASLADMVSACECGGITTLQTSGGDFVPQAEVDGRRVLVHSKFDPVREAERFVSETDPAAFDLIIVFGFGYAYHLESLLQKMKEDSVLLVIEKFPQMMKSAMENRALEKVLADKRVLVKIDPDEDELAESLRGKSSHKVSFITHRGSYQLDPDYYSNMTLIVKSYLSTKEVNIATLAKFEKLWASNAARNMKRYFSLPAAKSFYGKFSGYPALVVCAGPSLDFSIESIRSVKEKAIIIAVDTAYGILRRHDIEPDFVLCVDPQVINARYFEGDAIGNGAILIADPTVHPSVFRLFHGKQAVSGIPFKSMAWAADIAGDKGDIAHGGSVSTNAYDFAKKLGAAPVILIGQDLAFTGNLAHARGSYLDEQVHIRTHRFSNSHMFNRRQLTALPKIFVKGIRSQQIHTNQKMVIFQNWFEKQNDANLINASYDGAFIADVLHKQLADIPFANAVDKKNIREIYNNEVEKTAGDLSDIIEKGVDKSGRILNELEALNERVSGAVHLAEELCRMIQQGKRSDRTNFILARLDEVDAYINARSSAADMIGMTVQKVIHTITEGYEIDGESAGNKELTIAKRSLYLYRGIKEGTDFNLKIMRKARDILLG